MMFYFRNVSLFLLGKHSLIFNERYFKRIPCQYFHYLMQFKAVNKFNQSRLLTTTTSNLQEEEKSEPKYEVTFIKRNGDKIKASGKEGDSLLDLVVNNSLDFDGFGACEGTLTCSTCHVILKKEDYDRLSDKPTDEEMDMLDLAYELTETSRLGCQITLTKDLDGLQVQLPSSINDARS